MMTNQEIIELAVLTLAVDASPDDADLEARLDARLDAIGPDLAVLVLGYFAYKLLSGEPYCFNTDNTETVRRARAMAADLGASVTEFDQGGGRTQIVFTPARSN
jgi:hypothetical protein